MPIFVIIVRNLHKKKAKRNKKEKEIKNLLINNHYAKFQNQERNNEKTRL